MIRAGYRTIVALAVVGAVAASAVVGALYVGRAPSPAEQAAGKPSGPVEPAPQQAAEAPKKPALYCQFYVFVESRPFVAFLLEQTPDDPALFRQVYVAKADGDRTDYNVLAGKTPEWRLDQAANPPRLAGQITVPDMSQAGLGEQEIAIELRDFDAADTGGAWTEASLKSIYYQNLPGKCRRTATQERPA